MKRPDSNTREGRKWFTPSLGGGRGEAPAFTPLLAILAVFVMSSCTILDNDLRGLSDAPGFKSMVHEETDEYTCDYQYRPEVTYVDDYLAPYITSISEDYSTLYLADYIPDNYLPVPGELLASLATDKLTYGMQHRVLSVTKGNGLYAVKLERAPLEDIFSHFVFNMNYDENIDPSEYNYDPDVEEDQINTNIAYQAPARRATTDIDWDNWEPKLKKIDQGQNSFDRIPPLRLDITGSGNLDESKKDVVKVSGSATLSAMFGIMPYVQGVCHIDMEKEQYDLGVIFGFYMQAGFNLKGKGGVDIDFVQWFRNKLEKELQKTIKVQPGGVPLKITFEPVVKWENTIDASSSLGTQITFGKFFGTGISWGMPKRDNGPYWRSIESANDVYFSLPTQCGFASQLKVGAKINIALDTPPGPFLDVGIELTPTIGPKFRMGASSASSDPNYQYLHTGVPFEIGSKAYAKLFECLKYEFNITDYIKKCLGSKSNTDVVYEFFAKDWHQYPYVENMGITCQNPKSWTPPIFNLSFDLKKGIYDASEMVLTHPEIHIFRKNDIDPSRFSREIDPKIESQPIAVKVFDPLKDKDINSYKWTTDNAILERDKTYYAVLYYINDKPYTRRVIYNHAYAFTSTSPSIVMIGGPTVSTQLYVYHKRSGVTHYYYEFKFRTKVQPFGDVDDITEWGFQVGNKTYSIKQPISGLNSKMILWHIKKSDKASRTIVFRPYVKFKVEDNEMTNWGEPHTINLEYDDDPNIIDIHDEYYKQTTEKDKDGKTYKADWYKTGYEHEDYYGRVEYDMSGETMRAPEVTMTPIEDGEDLPADAIDDNDYDDLEIEIVEVE